MSDEREAGEQAAAAPAGGPGPGGHVPAELRQMWLALLREGWKSIAVVPTEPQGSARPVTDALAAVAPLQEVEPLKVLDAQGASIADGPRLVEELASIVASGARAVVAVDSLLRDLGGVPLVRDADAAILVIRLGVARIEDVQSTIEIVGRHRILGSVVVSEERASKT